MQIIVSDRQDPAFNLALEEYLFNQEEVYTLFYSNTASVIIGSNQIWENEIDQQFCDAHQIPLYRRISGGGAVYHDLGNLNYSFIFNKEGSSFNLNAEYLKPIVMALTYFGIQPVVGKRKDLWLPDGHKISGTASHITGKRVMHHGTILYDSDLHMLNSALLSSLKVTEVKGIPSVVSPVKNIRTYCEEFGLPLYTSTEFFRLLIEKVSHILNVEKLIYLDKAKIESVEALADSKYRLKAWNRKK